MFAYIFIHTCDCSKQCNVIEHILTKSKKKNLLLFVQLFLLEISMDTRLIYGFVFFGQKLLLWISYVLIFANVKMPYVSLWLLLNMLHCCCCCLFLLLSQYFGDVTIEVIIYRMKYGVGITISVWCNKYFIFRTIIAYEWSQLRTHTLTHTYNIVIN